MEKAGGPSLIFKVLLFLLILTIFSLSIASLAITVQVKNSQNDLKKTVNAMNKSIPPEIYPTQAPDKNVMNIPSNPQVSSLDADKYNGYKKALKEFQYSVDFTADPCNDFYRYACGNYKKKVSIYDMMNNNYARMVNQLMDPSYQATIQNSTALLKEKDFFNACINITSDPSVNNNTLVQNNYLLDKVNNLATLLGTKFTTVYNGSITALPSAAQLASAIGYLSFTEGIDTYVTPMVDTYWRNNTKGNLFFIDQNSAEYDKTYYAPNVWKTFEEQYIQSTVAVLNRFCLEQNLTCVDLYSKTKILIDFEQIIAYNYSTDETTRRNANRNWKLQSVNDLNKAYTFLDWNAYINQLPAIAQPIVNAPNYQLDFMEPDMVKKLNDAFPTFEPASVVNYLYMRLILDSAQYLPSYKSAFAMMPKWKHSPKIGIDRMERRQKRRRRREMFLSDAPTDTQMSCMQIVDDLMQYSNGRIFVDNIYPNQDARNAIRKTAGGMIQNIKNAFQGMLESLDWMDDNTKSAALDKTNNIIANIAFPDWILNNTQLDSYYQNLNFTSVNDFYKMMDILIQFNIFLDYQKLTVTPADRKDFQAGPGIVNAWYQPEFNSITLAAGMLQAPFFDQNFPASINYGGIGIVSGHELTHGFDDQGIQWGPTGNLPEKPWMDNNSTIGFQNMAQCVINEYSNFCPLSASQYTPNCINGQQTQGENIADNGGIHSAFRAYRSHIALDGPDPTLPDPIFSQFTHDQLFFLNYGQIWCEASVSDGDLYQQLMTDPHSPAYYRVYGTIQNFPAFRVAYNCPIGSKYSPVTHCKVWVPNNEA